MSSGVSKIHKRASTHNQFYRVRVSPRIFAARWPRAGECDTNTSTTKNSIKCRTIIGPPPPRLTCCQSGSCPWSPMLPHAGRTWICTSQPRQGQENACTQIESKLEIQMQRTMPHDKSSSVSASAGSHPSYTKGETWLRKRRPLHNDADLSTDKDR